MRVLIVDDEAAARSRLARLLSAYPDVEIAGQAEDGLEALRQIETLRPDLAFLDIEMPGLNGFEVVRSIAPGNAPMVVFATGYDEHALEAFDVNALAYLLKPVETERLTQALDRARKLCQSSEARATEHRKALAAAPTLLRRIVCRARDRMVLTPVEQIVWFQVADGEVKAATQSECYTVNFALAELEASLSPELFFRARRDTLINLSRIREIRPWFKSGFQLVMNDAGSTEITVSERQVHQFRRRMPGL